MSEYVYILLIVAVFFLLIISKSVRRFFLRAISGCGILVVADFLSSSVVLSLPGVLMSLFLGIPGALSYFAVNFIIK